MAAWLTGALHAALPGVRVQSWLGDVVGGGHLDLASPSTRQRILASDRQVLAEGFDGVHYDLEPVPSGNRFYLDLLAETHALTRADGALLSVSADQIEPLPGLAAPEQWLFGRPHWWSTGFLHQVATRVDEVAIMTYDTALPTRAAYAGYVRVETRLALRAVPSTVALLIGLPAYHTHDLGHWNSAETVAAAIRGVRLALGPHPPRRPLGVALYVDFAATPADWSSYQRDWVMPDT
jgi:hypothetical protein